MTEHAVRTNHLTKYFGRKCVVSDLNLCVPRGSISGFLGRNGSGKTTTLRMLLGLLAPARRGRMRRVDEALCRRCRSPHAPPEADGREIFEPADPSPAPGLPAGI